MVGISMYEVYSRLVIWMTMRTSEHSYQARTTVVLSQSRHSTIYSKRPLNARQPAAARKRQRDWRHCSQFVLHSHKPLDRLRVGVLLLGLKSQLAKALILKRVNLVRDVHDQQLVHRARVNNNGNYYPTSRGFAY